MINRWIYRWAYRLMLSRGWSFTGEKPPDAKFLLIGAPHTSNWDFLLTLGLIYHFDLPLRYMVKKQVFWWPWAWLLRSLGAVPIDRSRRVNVVDSTVEVIQQSSEIVIGILPEGTRSRSETWKSGFYHIALKAQVPLVLVKVDGGRRQVELGPRLELTGDQGADLNTIADYYRDVVAIYPENFGPIRFR